MTEPEVRRVRVRLFGRPAVLVDDIPLPLRGSFPVAVVARLALAAGGTLGTEELVAALWDAPPPAAVGTLRANMSRLRSAGLDAAIRGGRGGYGLAVDADDVDVLAFRSAAQAALAGDAAALQRAESLWNGEPLRDVDVPFAASVRAELVDLHRRLAEELAATRLERGELEPVLATLPALVREHPWQEEPVRLLALALSRSGRTADALQAIDDFVARIAQRGLEPSPTLAGVRLAILRHAPEVTGAQIAAPRRHGVPLPITRFVGRVRELELLAQARRESRLVTLTGPGGVGKSRLAVESLRVDDLDTELWMLELAALDDAESVELALAALVGVTNPTRTAIAGQLSSAGSLLVLDNAEHVLDAVASLVTDLLAMSPGLSILVTSREPLRIPGERLVPVGTMLEGGAEDAVELFRQRAADAHPGFELDTPTLAAVRELVRLLDGVPLALELTAARLDVMDLGELTRSQELLLGGGGEGRHASLRNTLAWSVRLLDAVEVELLAQLAGFAGPVPLEAIAGICALGDEDVRAVATSLAQKSLLAVEGASGSRRYRLLETVKLYARQLPKADDPERWRMRHAAWFADWVDAQEAGLHDARSLEVHDAFDGVRPDLLLAIRSAVEGRDRGLAVRLAGGQAWYLFMKGAMCESKRLIDEALGMQGESDAFFDARALWGAVMLIYRSGDKNGGEVYAHRGLPLAEASGDPTLRALFLACNGMWAAKRGDPQRGDELITAAEALGGEISRWALSEVLIFRAIASIYGGRRADAIGSLQRSAQLALGSGNTWAAGAAMWRIAHSLILLRRDAEALQQLVAALDTIAEQDDVLARILAIHAAALAATGLDRATDAARLFGAVDQLGTQYGFEREAVNDDEHESYRRRARAALTPREWNPAYTEGRRLSLDEALGLVRSLAARVRR